MALRADLTAGDLGHITDHEEIAATILTKAAARATYALGFAVAVPTGADDTAMLAAAFAATRHVTLQAGATYKLAGAPGSLPAFSGLLSGNLATFSFEFAGIYDAGGWVRNWSDVLVTDLKMKAVSAQHLAMFDESCRDLVFRGCTWFDSSILVCNPFTSGGLTIEHSLFTETAGRPATMTMAVTIPETGRFVFDHNVVNFRPNGTAGAIVTSVSTDVAGQSRVWVTDNVFFDAQQAGYSLDAPIDIEPRGPVPHELVEISGNVVYNGSIYLSGARLINAHHNLIRHTSVNTQDRLTAFIVFNSNGVQPATGIVSIHDNRVIQDDVATAATAKVLDVLLAVEELHLGDNHLDVNAATLAPAPVYSIASTIDRLVIDGDTVEGAAGTVYAGVPLVSFTAGLPAQMELRACRLAGRYLRLVELGAATSGTISLLRVTDNDLTDLTLADGPTAAFWLTNGGPGTVTRRIFDRNVGASTDAAFHAGLTANQAIAAGAFTDVAYTAEQYDDTGNYSVNEFSAPVDGNYTFTASVSPTDPPAATTRITLTAYVNGAARSLMADQTGARQTVGTTTLRLLRGDAVRVFVFSSVAVTIQPAAEATYFAGARVA